MIRPDAELTFENGMLVKVDGRRPAYMSGDELIALTTLLGKHLYRARKGLQNSNNKLYAQGAGLGSTIYFEIRTELVEAMKQTGGFLGKDDA